MTQARNALTPQYTRLDASRSYTAQRGRHALHAEEAAAEDAAGAEGPAQPTACMSRARTAGRDVGKKGERGATRRCHRSEAHLIKNQARELARSDAGKAGVHGSTQNPFLVGQLVISGRSMPGHGCACAWWPGWVKSCEVEFSVQMIRSVAAAVPDFGLLLLQVRTRKEVGSCCRRVSQDKRRGLLLLLSFSTRTC